MGKPNGHGFRRCVHPAQDDLAGESARGGRRLGFTHMPTRIRAGGLVDALTAAAVGRLRSWQADRRARALGPGGKRASRTKTMRRFIRVTVRPFHNMPGHQHNRQFTSPTWRDTRTPVADTPPTGCIFENLRNPTPWRVRIRGWPKRSRNTCRPRPERKPHQGIGFFAPESMFGSWSARPSRSWVSSPGLVSLPGRQNRRKSKTGPITPARASGRKIGPQKCSVPLGNDARSAVRRLGAIGGLVRTDGGCGAD